jgi:hypothetical protein
MSHILFLAHKSMNAEGVTWHQIQNMINIFMDIIDHYHMPTVSRAPFSHSRASEHEPRERRRPQYLSCSIVLLQLSLLCDIRRFVLVPSRITLIDPYSQHGEEQSVDQQQQPWSSAPSGAWTLPWKWQGCPSISTPTSHVSHDTDASSLRC